MLGSSYITDVYSFWKAAAITFLGAMAFLQSRLRLTWIAAAAGIALSCLLADHMALAWFGYVGQFFGGLVLLSLVSLAHNIPHDELVTRALVWGSIPVAFLSLFPSYMPWGLIAGGSHIDITGTNSAAGTLFNSNYIGFYAAMVVPYLWAERRLISGAFLAIALIASGSFSGMAGTAVGLLYVLFFDTRNKTAVVLASASFAFLIIVAFALKPDLSGRLEIWQNTLPLISLFGAGFGAFPLEYPQTGSVFVDKPHSMYLQFAHALGWVGFACVLVFLAFRLRPRSVAFAGGLIGGLVAGICSDLYVGVAPIFAIMLGASLKTEASRG